MILRVAALALIVVALLSGCTVSVTGHARPADAYVDPQGSYTLLVPAEWELVAPGRSEPGEEAWFVPGGGDGDGPPPIVAVRTRSIEDDPGLILFLYQLQLGILDLGLDDLRVNSARIVTGTAGDTLGVLDCSGTSGGNEARVLYAIAINDSESVIAAGFVAPSGFEELRPALESALLTLHKL